MREIERNLRRIGGTFWKVRYVLGRTLIPTRLLQPIQSKNHMPTRPIKYIRGGH